MEHITLHDEVSFNTAVNTLALESAVPYETDAATLTIYSPDIQEVMGLLTDNGIDSFVAFRENDEPFDGFRTDAEADADALASAGFGTDEDYGGGAEDIGGWDE